MVDLIIHIASTVAITALIFECLRLRKKRRQTFDMLIQANIDKTIILEKLAQEMDARVSESVEQTDGFLKFVSESRDWAFKYIEEVQQALEEFDKKVSPVLEYATTYGTVVESHLSPSINTIADAYKELHKILPKEDSL